MKRLLTVAAGLSLIAGFTFAQTRDVPPGHWAYQAIEQLVRDGIIEGYPDGTFRPNRTMTRAEFAQAIARAYNNINERLQALSRRIDEIANAPRGGGQQAPTADEQARRDIQALRNEINELKKLNDALQTLQRLAQTFQQELANLGVDVDSLKKDVASLRDRVAALEAKKEGFSISGDVSFGVTGVNNIDRKGATTLNGNNVAATDDLLETLNIYHELGLTFSGQVNENVSGTATFVLGNYLSAFPNTISRVGRGPAGNTDIAIWEAYVKTPIDLFGTKVDVTIGRFPAQLTPFTLKRVKPDYYLNFPRYDDGAYRVDGAAFAFNFDTFRLNLWAAQTAAINSTAGQFSTLPFYNHNSATSRAADQFAGARLEFDAVRGEETSLTIGATYFAAGIGVGQNFNFAGGPAEAVNIDRVDVFGADIKAKFAGFNIGAEYAQSNFMRGTSNVLDEDNWALDVNLSYNFSENLGVTAGYREVRPYFASPGYWGRVAYLYNPSDLRGAYANVSWKPSEDLNVRVGGAFLEGTGRVAGGYTKNDEVVHAVAGIDYRLSDRWNVSLNYEGAFWKVGGVKPVWNYVTVGLGYNLGENASWNLLYQIIDNDGKGNAAFSGGPNPNKNQAGVAATTLTIKF